jgi:hypothetical protein
MKLSFRFANPVHVVQMLNVSLAKKEKNAGATLALLAIHLLVAK